MTGGVFFAHTLFINLIRIALDDTGLSARLPWEAIVVILFVATVSVTATFIALVLGTPLRWLLGGPVRSAQRASYSPPLRESPGQLHGHGTRPLGSLSVGIRQPNGGHG